MARRVGRRARGALHRAADHALRHRGPRVQDRLRGGGLRPGRLRHRPPRRPPDGPGQPVRRRRGPDGRRGRRPRDRGRRRAGGRGDLDRQRRERDVRGEPHRPPRARPRPGLPADGPDDDREHVGGPRLDAARPARPQLVRGHGVRLGQPRHRRGRRHHPARRGRRDDRGRHRGGRHALLHGRPRRDPRPVAAQRRPRAREPAVRHGPRRLRLGRGRRRPGAREPRARPGPRGADRLRAARIRREQ